MRRIILILCILALASVASAQTTHLCQDSLAVSETMATKTFTTRYIECSLYFNGCTGLIRVASSDQDSTGIFCTNDSQTNKKWITLLPNQPFHIETDKALGTVGLKHIAYKSASGTGALMIIGVKRTYAE